MLAFPNASSAVTLKKVGLGSIIAAALMLPRQTVSAQAPCPTPLRATVCATPARANYLRGATITPPEVFVTRGADTTYAGTLQVNTRKSTAFVNDLGNRIWTTDAVLMNNGHETSLDAASDDKVIIVMPNAEHRIRRSPGVPGEVITFHGKKAVAYDVHNLYNAGLESGSVHHAHPTLLRMTTKDGKPCISGLTVDMLIEQGTQRISAQVSAPASPPLTQTITNSETNVTNQFGTPIQNPPTTNSSVAVAATQAVHAPTAGFTPPYQFTRLDGLATYNALRAHEGTVFNNGASNNFATKNADENNLGGKIQFAHHAPGLDLRAAGSYAAGNRSNKYASFSRTGSTRDLVGKVEVAVPIVSNLGPHVFGSYHKSTLGGEFRAGVTEKQLEIGLARLTKHTAINIGAGYMWQQHDVPQAHFSMRGPAARASMYFDTPISSAAELSFHPSLTYYKLRGELQGADVGVTGLRPELSVDFGLAFARNANVQLLLHGKIGTDFAQGRFNAMQLQSNAYEVGIGLRWHLGERSARQH